jgi:dienelactone hydrolase
MAKPVMLREEDVHGQVLDHLGLVSSVISRLKLIEKVDARIKVSKDNGAKVTMGQRVAAMLGLPAGDEFAHTLGVEQSEKRMKSAGKTFEPVYYDDAGHGFMRAGQAPDASEGNQAGRKAAWKRWLELLKQAAEK